MIIELDNISNARDLGGMIGTSGRKIKPKRLIRSSALHFANKKDADILINKYNLKHVVDFRTNIEKEEKPHPIDIFETVKYSHLQSFDKVQEVVTRDKKSDYLLIQKSQNMTVEDAINSIIDFYEQLPTITSLQLAYKKFFEILLNNENGSVLWHCVLGKDRAGIASVLIEYILGVSQDGIMQDYLETNNCLDEKHVVLKNDNPFRVFYGVKDCFLEAWYNSVNENYGSIENYLKKSLNVDSDKIKKLREMYLE